jgi:hypothetical protein
MPDHDRLRRRDAQQRRKEDEGGSDSGQLAAAGRCQREETADSFDPALCQPESSERQRCREREQRVERREERDARQ